MLELITDEFLPLNKYSSIIDIVTKSNQSIYKNNFSLIKKCISDCKILSKLYKNENRSVRNILP